MTAAHHDHDADSIAHWGIPRVVHDEDNPDLDQVPPAPTRDQAAAARLSWEVAVDQLVQPGLYVVHRQDDGHEVAEVLPLLAQVQEAVTPGSKREGTTGKLGSRPPASLGALELLAEIRHEVRRACVGHRHPYHNPGSLRELVQVWGEHAEDWQHAAADYVLWAAERAAEWVRTARLLLDPVPRYPLRGRACPVCGVATVQVWSDDEADFVRRPALSIDPEQVEAVCAACGQRWPLDVWAQLAQTLDDQLRHETT
ncbi:hypothetical protein [Umezawaea sp. Da 62-37]|uniref:DUF7341 domain-containing protein n=1 Tax=Umezawaea sp. Da 62-37 TaxID=3075927 RepID=UPI0028F6CEC4|nr:hypothetical protein [Umezawaea sp. Da 62-37]WNV86590.1 hypothetical protein RM788_52180 [Umezawaea sp. Da 62-37]